VVYWVNSGFYWTITARRCQINIEVKTFKEQ